MRQATSGAPDAAIGVTRQRLGNLLRQVFYAAFIALVAAILCWGVWLYGTALRDARYLDGWMLAGGMLIQVYYHVRRQTGGFAPKSAMAWRQFHIFIGYLIFALFISHTDYGLPNTIFEWALWSCFILITLSGIFGTYLAWVVPEKLGANDRTSLERIPIMRAEIGKKIHALATTADKGQLELALPISPYEDWIHDLYKNHLRTFLQGSRNRIAHLFGAQRHLKKIISEIDDLERYVDKSGRDKLFEMKALVLDKDRLDFAHVHLSLNKLWLFIHVPLTYTITILAVLHVLVVYAYSSGIW